MRHHGCAPQRTNLRSTRLSLWRLILSVVLAGVGAPEEARVHPQRNVIYKNLGDRSSVAPDITHLDLQPGDRLLLCSDGLSTEIEDQVIQQIAASAASPQEACRQLTEAANAAGGRDNITTIIVQMELLG